MSLRRTIVAVGVGAALAYFLDPVSGKERRAHLQQTIDDQLTRRAGVTAPWHKEDATVVSEAPR
jgi:hypothetical protein